MIEREFQYLSFGHAGMLDRGGIDRVLFCGDLGENGAILDKDYEEEKYTFIHTTSIYSR
jgi:hypothetical protein